MNTQLTTPPVKAQKRVIFFIASAIGLYLVWYILYELWLLPHSGLNQWLNHQTAQAGTGLLRLFGFNTSVQKSDIFLNNRRLLHIGNPCNALEFFALFSGFIMLFPGPWKVKFLFIPAGILLIFLLNIARVALLVVNYHYSHRTFDFNHKYTYSFFIYLVIFGMWMLWVNRFATRITLKQQE